MVRFLSVRAALFLVAVGFGASARADLLMENLFGPAPVNQSFAPGSNVMFVGATNWGAVGMNTGANSYEFGRMHFFIINNNFASNLLLDGGIYADSGGAPGALVKSFNTISVPPTTTALPQSWIFSTPTPTTLAASTNYWFVINAIQSGQPSAFLWTGATNFQPLSNYDGTSSLGFLNSPSAGASGTWSVPSVAVPGVIIEGTPIPAPEPATATILVLASGIVCRRSRAAARR